MRFSVESWNPDYGSPVEQGPLGEPDIRVDASVEMPLDDWRPLRPTALEPVKSILFVDGVRRIDARIWIVDDHDHVHLGICASLAAGTVRCDGQAKLESWEVSRGVFSAMLADPIDFGHALYTPMAVAADEPQQLMNGLQQRLRELEIQVAEAAEPAEMLVVDGPLSGRQNVPDAIGLVKSHTVEYLPDSVNQVVAELAPAERTPIFVTQTTWSRYSWYQRLPGGSGHPWAGVVRCETSADLSRDDAVRRADLAAATLGRFASEPFKDSRAPQNLYPIGGLERELRRRLGDLDLLYRGLRREALRAERNA